MGVVIRRPVEGFAFARVALAVVLALHGMAHFAGLVDSVDRAGTSASAEYLGGLWVISDRTVLRAIGLLWAIVGIVVVASAVFVMLRTRHARETVMMATMLSLALSVVGLWAAVVGVAVNGVLFTLVAFAPKRAGLGRLS